jgi:hypothetical protein
LFYVSGGRTHFAPVTIATLLVRSGMPVAGSHMVENQEPIWIVQSFLFSSVWVEVFFAV